MFNLNIHTIFVALITTANCYTNPLLGIDIKLVTDTKMAQKGFLSNDTVYNNIIEGGNINKEFRYTEEDPFPCCREINHFIENERVFRYIVVKNNLEAKQKCNFQVSTPNRHIMNPFFLNYQNTSDLNFELEKFGSLYFHLMYNITEYQVFDGFSQINLKVYCYDSQKEERVTFNSKFAFYMGSASKYNNVYLVEVLTIILITLLLVNDTMKGVILTQGDSIQKLIFRVEQRKRQLEEEALKIQQEAQESQGIIQDETNKENIPKKPSNPIDLDLEFDRKESLFEKYSLTRLHPLIGGLIVETWLVTTAEFIQKYLQFTTTVVISVFVVIIFQGMAGGIQYFLNKETSYYVRAVVNMLIFGTFVNFRHYLLTNLIGILFVVSLLQSYRFQFKSVKNIFNILLLLVIVDYVSNYVERFPSSLTRVVSRLFIFRNTEPKYPTHFWLPNGIFCQSFGFFDLLIPCLIIQYYSRIPNTSVYQYTGMIGFAAALIFNSVYIYYYRTILVFSFLILPTMVLPIIVISLIRGEFKLLWKKIIEPNEPLYRSLMMNSSDLSIPPYQIPTEESDYDQKQQ